MRRFKGYKGKPNLEVAVRIAGHASMQTAQLYNKLLEEISLDEIERIHIFAEALGRPELGRPSCR